MSEKGQYWAILDDFLSSSSIIVDRPQNSPHPRYPHIIYPLDYGYLDGTNSGDGEGIDIWLGSLPDVPPRIVGAVATVDAEKRDAEIKLLINCTEDEIGVVTGFITTHGMGCYLIERTD